ncbi:MAG: RidA family protein [Rhizobiaceae bacterium]
MTIERLGKGGRMSQAVVHDNIAYLSGQVGSGATVAEQTLDALAEVDKWLAEAGTDKSRILSVTVWLADMAGFDEMNGVYDRWIDPDNPPARAAGESQLATPDYLVEFMVVAAR